MMLRSTKAMLAFLAVTGSGALLRLTEAHATPIIQTRCSLDNVLLASDARLRLEWARACGTRKNIISPTAPIPPAQVFLTGLTSANGGIPLMDYVETDDFWGKNSYSGDVATVNEVFRQSQWRWGPISASTDAAGFQKWSEADPLRLTRPLYPTFGNNADINLSTQLFPNPSYSLVDCNLYTDAAAMHRADTSVTGLFVNAYCTGGCFTPDQQISFASGDEPILNALDALRTGVKTLTPDSTLENVKLKTDDVASYSRDIHDASLVTFEIRTQSGGQLRVTDKHPVLIDSGRLVEAHTLKAGTKLIKADGSRDAIVSVTKAPYFGKAYTLKPVSTNRVSNLIIAQGFLVGSSRFQNEDADYLNRIILGRAIPKSVIPR
jgi:hypothetical protein